jgi:hypothetical protein
MTKNEKISETMKNNSSIGKHRRKQIKCIETTEAWLSLTEFAKEKEITLGYASKILKKGSYKGLHYKWVKNPI